MNYYAVQLAGRFYDEMIYDARFGSVGAAGRSPAARARAAAY